MYVNEQQLRTKIQALGTVSARDFDASTKEADDMGESIKKVLLDRGILSEEMIHQVEADIMGIPYVKLNIEKIDVKTLSLIPEAIAQTNNIVAYNQVEEGLEVAMLDANDLNVIDFIKKKLKVKILPRITDKASLVGALTRYKKSLKAEFDSIIQSESASYKATEDKEKKDLSERDLKELAEDLPIVKIVDTLISHAILQRASDIHIEPTEEEVVVRYRIDGMLHDVMKLPKEVAPAIVARIKVLSNLKLDEKRLPQDGRFKISSDTQKVSFRVSTLPVYFGEKVVIRVLNESSYGFTLEELGFHHEALDVLHKAITLSTGMILISGPTGSGKTTTLYTILDILNTPDVNISTIEDPIEYQMPRVNQTQVRPEIGLTFGAGLRALLRQDPDMIMVGEIRDQETASLAINAALTGHLVLSTIHTNSAVASIPRLTDMGAEPFLVASTVKIIIAQRLVRRLAKNKVEYKLTQEMVEQLKKTVSMDALLTYMQDRAIVPKTATWTSIPFYKPADEQDGYAGRLAIHEVLDVNSAIREGINTGKSLDDLRDLARKSGMVTMLEDGIIQAVNGATTIEEVLRVISE